jgi:hypothetical protein
MAKKKKSAAARSKAKARPTKRTPARKPAAKKVASRGRAKRQSASVVTEFMQDFSAEFIRDGNSELLWPPAGHSDRAVFSDISEVLTVLGEARKGVRPPSGGTDSLRDRVIDFITLHHWPEEPAIPPNTLPDVTTTRLLEIAVIIDRMLAAVNEGVGGGGSTREWPPHGP